MGRSSQTRIRVIALLAGSAGLAVAIGLVVLVSSSGSGGDPSDPVQSDPAHQAPAAQRTVLVAERGGEELSIPGMPMHAGLIGGRIPAGETTAEVMTDTDCAPDRRGVSHCHNKLRLADGSKITVIHEHRMSDVPCLSPGETVAVAPA